jgi:DNA polymerase-3 subunit delta
VQYAALLEALQRSDVPPVVLVHGTEHVLLDDVLGLASRALFPDASSAAFGREVLDARETTTDAVARSAATLPFLGGKRLVAVRHAEALAARGSEALADYLRAPNPTTCLLLLAGESLRADRERRTDHWLLKAVHPAAVVDASPRKDRDLERWVQQRAAAEGLSVTAEAARLLRQFVGNDMTAVLGEARKAALAGGPDNRRVGEGEVAAVVGERRLSGAFDLTKAIEAGQRDAALRILDDLFALGEEPMRLLGLLVSSVRRTWTIKDSVQRGQSTEQIARTLRLPPPVIDMLRARVAPVSTAEFARRLESCWRVEWRLKSGGKTPRAELTALVASLC